MTGVSKAGNMMSDKPERQVKMRKSVPGLLTGMAFYLMLSFFLTAANADPCSVGPTGLMTVPTPTTVGANHFGGGLYLDTYSIVRASRQRERRLNLIGTYGVTRDFEIGFTKTLDSFDYSYDPGLTVNLKYAFPETKAIGVAVGGVLETDNNKYSSVYMTVGQEVAFFGIGCNFGGHRGYPMNRAHFGSYDFGEMAPDTFFFFAGADFDLKIMHLTAEYNSDSFTVGTRFKTEEGYNFNLAYVTESDYDVLAQDIFGYTYRRDKILFGITGTF